MEPETQAASSADDVTTPELLGPMDLSAAADMLTDRDDATTPEAAAEGAGADRTPIAAPSESDVPSETQPAEKAEAPVDETEPEAEPGADEFAHGNLKVRLRDGRTPTVAELKKLADANAPEFERKSQELTAKEQQIAAQAQDIQQRHAQIAQQAQFFQQVIPIALARAQAAVPPATDTSLRETDPIEFFRLESIRAERIAEYRQLEHAVATQRAAQEAEVRRASEEAQRLDAERRDQRLAEERQKLADVMPELRDPTRKQAFAADFMKVGQHYGFTTEELSRVEDHRLFPLIRDAIAYRKLQAQKPAAQEKAKDAAPVKAPGRRVTEAEASARVTEEQLQRLRARGGRIDDAAAILATL